MKKRALVSTLLAASMVTGMLTGCGGDPAESSQPSSQQESSSEESKSEESAAPSDDAGSEESSSEESGSEDAAGTGSDASYQSLLEIDTLENPNVTLDHYWDPDGRDSFEMAAIKRYEEKYGEGTVTVNAIGWNKGIETMQANTAAGNQSDLIFTEGNACFPSYVTENYFQPITEFIQQDLGSDFMDQASMDNFKYQDEYYVFTNSARTKPYLVAYLGKKGGLRRDIAQALQEMHPKFMRFPGGCLIHDGSLNDHDRNSMYRWKRTIGKVEERPSWRNNWGYNQTLGLGYFEYFCFCEEIGAEPVPILPGGFNPHKGEGVELDQLGEWVQEALDLIEFANGSPEEGWGRVRKELGHEAPFGLKYIGIGNEEVGDGFFERYPYFHRAIREKYPDMKIINTAGPFSAGESFDAGWRCAQKYGSNLVDEHYYSAPEWFLANMHHYEDYDEKGPKVFLGEYASWGNTYYNALVEAAYMTHLERSKAVAMACYAPMLCNTDYVNWRPDMLWFDNHAILKTPNYHVQKLFMKNQGTDEIRFETEGLDEIIPLVDEENITGDVSIAGNDIQGSIWNVKAQDLSSGEARELPDISVDLDNRENMLLHTESNHYRISFRFRRLAGRKGLKIFFGKKDEKNRLCWEFGGWDNWDCTLVSSYGGRSSNISHRVFRVGDEEYLLELEVEGRKVRTWVNGELYNDAVDALPQLEELYVAASVDRGSGRTILKAVNLTGEEKKVQIVLEGVEKKAVQVSGMKGYGLGDTNTFEKPGHIAPKEEWLSVDGNRLEYTFAPHSVTVLSFAEAVNEGKGSAVEER